MHQSPRFQSLVAVLSAAVSVMICYQPPGYAAAHGISLGWLVPRNVIRIAVIHGTSCSRGGYRRGRPLISGLIEHCPHSEAYPHNTRAIMPYSNRLGPQIDQHFVLCKPVYSHKHLIRVYYIPSCSRPCHIRITERSARPTE